MLGCTRVVQSMRNGLLNDTNSILAEIKKMSFASNVNIDFSKKMKSQQLNRLFMSDGLREMLRRKEEKTSALWLWFFALSLLLETAALEGQSELCWRLRRHCPQIYWTRYMCPRESCPGKAELHILKAKYATLRGFVGDNFA